MCSVEHNEAFYSLRQAVVDKPVREGQNGHKRIKPHGREGLFARCSARGSLCGEKSDAKVPTFVMDAWRERYGGISFRVVDLCCLGYMVFVALSLLFFHLEVTNWPVHIFVHAVFMIAGLELIRLGELYPQNKFFWTLRTFYPIVFYCYGWSELHYLVRMYSGDYWATEWLIDLDKAIFGVHPTIWAKQLFTPWLHELMSFFYAAYYFFMPMVILPLYLRGKHEETLAALSFACLTYFINFLFFYGLPALGPQMVAWTTNLLEVQHTGWVISSFNRFVQANGTVVGGAFPSSHVSGSLVWALVAWRYNRRLGYVLLPMVAGVAISTVYLGYHHAVDPLAGLILGFICFRSAAVILKIRNEDPAARHGAQSVQADKFVESCSHDLAQTCVSFEVSDKGTI